MVEDFETGLSEVSDSPQPIVNNVGIKNEIRMKELVDMSHLLVMGVCFI